MKGARASEHRPALSPRPASLCVSRLHCPPTRRKTERLKLAHEGKGCSTLLEQVQTFQHGCSRHEVKKPTPSTDRTVARVSISVMAWMACATHSKRIEMVLWPSLWVQVLGNCAATLDPSARNVPCLPVCPSVAASVRWSCQRDHPRRLALCFSNSGTRQDPDRNETQGLPQRGVSEGVLLEPVGA